MSYSGPCLEDVQGAFLDAPCMAALGDSIAYQPAGGAFAPLKAYVDYGDAIMDMDAGKYIGQDITVEVLIADVPVKPTATCRVTLGKIAGATFKPVNVRRDQSGAHWKFEVAKVNG